MKNIQKIQIIYFTLILVLSSCKEQFLDAKPDDALVVPETLAELQAILDHDRYMNGGTSHGPDPYIGSVGSDDHFITSEIYQTLDDFSREAYIWSKDLSYIPSTKNWIGPYRVIFYANTVLDLLDKVKYRESELNEYNNIKGSALFYRAYQFYNLAQLFAPQFKSNTASSDLGIPLRLSADISTPSTRSSVKETYDQIIKDLSFAKELLPDVPLVKTRPSRAAVYGLLSRVYLTMGMYDKAIAYSDLCLVINNNLIDYSSITGGSGFSFKRFNKEVIFHSVLSAEYPGLLINHSKVDSTLYDSYASSDLRKSLFFKNSGAYHSFIGSYAGNSTHFTGLTVGEIYLIKAECLARTDKIQDALESLNSLLINRYDKNEFNKIETDNTDVALTVILEERRKELVMRNLRWSDLRRLNTDERFAKTIQRNIHGQIYSLPPNDNRYTWPIPNYVIGFTDFIQNP